MSRDFIQRVMNYVANEIIIKGLANSKVFQRVVVRADHQLRQFHQTGQEQLERTAEQLSKLNQAGSQAAGPPVPPLTGFPGFVSAFFKEVRKDLGMGK